MTSSAAKNKVSLDMVSIIAAAERFSARLRKTRQFIYQNLGFKNKMRKILDDYKKQIKKFLNNFSAKSKPKEILIWKDEVKKTSLNVQAALKFEKGKPHEEIKKVKSLSKYKIFHEIKILSMTFQTITIAYKGLNYCLCFQLGQSLG